MRPPSLPSDPPKLNPFALPSEINVLSGLMVFAAVMLSLNAAVFFRGIYLGGTPAEGIIVGAAAPVRGLAAAASADIAAATRLDAGLALQTLVALGLVPLAVLALAWMLYILQ